MKVGNSFEVRGAEIFFSGSGSLLGPAAGLIPPRHGTGPSRSVRQELRQNCDDNMIKTLAPKPLPMSPAYRNGYQSLSERLQAEVNDIYPDPTATAPPGNSQSSGRSVYARETASHSRDGRETAARENGPSSHQDLREVLAAQRELIASQRAVTSREREPASIVELGPARIPERPERPPSGRSVETRATPTERQRAETWAGPLDVPRPAARRQPERPGAETRAASGNSRKTAIDLSMRTLSGPTQRGGQSASDRLNLQRRATVSSAPRQDPGLDDDCAEYNDRFLAGYEKGRLLGRGACAVVWLAHPTGQKGCVAIKQVIVGKTGKKRSDAESARKEIFFGSYFFHPGGEPKLSPARYPGIQHIAKLLDYSETKRDIWMVMEYGGTCLTKMAYEIKGEFLRGERLYRVIHLPLLQAMKRDPEVLKDMLRQLLSALCVLADNHIVHSDIKPDNILIEEDENHQLRCRFIDLGSAFTFDNPENLALATPEYMPPEALETCVAKCGGNRISRGSVSSMASGARKSVDPSEKLHRKSLPWAYDIWSLGSILLELCLGTPLWLSYKCRVADDQRANSAAMGLFAVPGRDPEKIITKQQDALRQRGLANVLKNAQGIPINNSGEGSGLELLSLMLAWDPLERISPQEALEHPYLCNYDD